jgi:hypothetical protein
MWLYGKIVDANDNTPLAGTTVEVTNQYQQSKGIFTTANGRGYFELNNPLITETDILVFTNAEFKTLAVRAVDIAIDTYYNASEGSLIMLDPDTKTGSNVTVYASPKKKNNSLLIIGAALLLIAAMEKKKRTVGKLSSADMKMIGIALVGLIAINAGAHIIDKILLLLGIGKSKDTSDLDDINTSGSSTNFWSPDFWKQSDPAHTRVLNDAVTTDFAKRLHNGLGLFSDDEEGIINIFRQMPTQASVSYLADKFAQLYSKDLFAYLRGGSWWQVGFDGLSDAELNSITQMISAKPKYW